MAKEKNSDVRLLKLSHKVTPGRVLTLGYVLFQSEIIKTPTEVSFHINFLPIVKNSIEGESDNKPMQSGQINEKNSPEEPEVTATVHSGGENEFRKDNRLSATADLITKTITFPHMNRFKLDSAYRGYGLGSYAMNELVTNLKNMFPDFAVQPVYFFFDHKKDDEDRDAFFSFMEKFGFWFSFDGENNNKGMLNLERAEMFKTCVKKDTIAEIELASFLRGLFKERDELRKELGKIKSEYKKNSTYMNRFEKDQTIRFLINVIIALGVLLLMVLFI